MRADIQGELFDFSETREEMPGMLIYRHDASGVKLNVRLEGETVWLSQQQMADLYQTSKRNIAVHIKNVLEEGELDVDQAERLVLQTRQEGRREVTREVTLYNLDMIISVGYRVKSVLATRFRQWATARLTEYIRKGFTMDDARLKELGGGSYWKELLDRIRDIRSSEKVMYRQVLDLYATSADYDPQSSISREFFSMVQNKFHFAAHGQTAAEVIYDRADARKPFMGLRTFTGAFPMLKDAQVAKNYLTEEELKALNNLVSGYFDFAELAARRHRLMRMEDYLKQLDNLLSSIGEPVLEHKGRVSHQEAMDKAEREYRQYQLETLSPVEQAYVEYMKELSETARQIPQE
ncbi:MAG: virulence RhuM family protein [Akkermansia sp.]|nr:virulence RhuM family protein [Akkermansia sp.]MBQ8376031.1 virulence RhuM family protein [Akkermansia sp.]